MAAQSGCVAVAIEPQLLCMRHIAAAARANGGLPVRAYQNILGIKNFSARVRRDQCTGTRQFLDDGRVADAYNINGTDSENATLLQDVLAARLDDLVGASERVALWHVDTEGAEKLVLESAPRLFAEQRIDRSTVSTRVILEWEPERLETFGLSLEEANTFMAGLFLGWSCRRLCSSEPVDWWTQLPISILPHMDVYCTRPGICEPPLGKQTSERMAEACGAVAARVAEATLAQSESEEWTGEETAEMEESA
jgi:FkbM family methyltransferase